MTPEELDKWAAERVMGWSKGYISSIPNWPEQWITKDRQPAGFTVKRRKGKEQVWQPTKDLEQAFMVVREMRKKGWVFAMDNEQNYIARFFIPGSGMPGSSFVADHPALTIIKAAYVALEGK